MRHTSLPSVQKRKPAVAGQLHQLSKNRDCRLFLKTLTKGGILAVSHSLFLWWKKTTLPCGLFQPSETLPCGQNQPCQLSMRKCRRCMCQACRGLGWLCAWGAETWADYVLRVPRPGLTMRLGLWDDLGWLCVGLYRGLSDYVLGCRGLSYVPRVPRLGLTMC